MKRCKLIREVNGKKRYYILSLELTLFGEFLLERIYGALANKAPTGIKKSYYKDSQEALKAWERILKSKFAKGYRQI